MNNHNSARPRPVLQWEEVFSPASIMRQLCRERMKEAEKRREQLFYSRLRQIPNAPSPNSLPDLFPPRRLWGHSRPRERENILRQDVQARSIFRAMQSGKAHGQWKDNLSAFIERIRARALSSGGFTLPAPTIRLVPKKSDDNSFRAISEFPLEDKILLSLANRYFSSLFDPHFLACSIGFRRTGRDVRTDVPHEIRRITVRRGTAPLYVAECDIRGFFDSLDHTIVRQSFAKLADATLTPDPRAAAVLDSYLDCYSFPRNVLSVIGDADVPWPEESLRLYHRSPRSVGIGIPQGGALSNIITNIVLHQADLAINDLIVRVPMVLHYWRYCDDMLLIAPRRQWCRDAFQVYLESMARLHLPVHPSSEQRVYTGGYKLAFWKGKSRSTYLWGNREGEYPWISFIGYQVRHDGLLRIRKSSLKNIFAGITKLCDDVLARVGPKRGTQYYPRNIRKTKAQILHRLRSKIAAQIAGDPNGKEPCWGAAYRALRNGPIVGAQLKALDHHLERHFARLRRRLKDLPPPQKACDVHRGSYRNVLGKAFSYFGQSE